MLKFASLFSCAGCVDQLPVANGYSIELAVEYDNEMADLYAKNHGEGHLYRGDILSVPLSTIPKLDWLHASPPCVLDSDAKQTSATLEDRHKQKLTLRKTLEIAQQSGSGFISIENVPGFYRTDAFAELVKCLSQDGYQHWVVTSFVKGIGQKRKRTFAFFLKDGDPRFLPKLSAKTPEHRGWGDIIDINKLEKTEYTHLKHQPALIKRLLKEGLDEPVIMERGKMSGFPRYRKSSEELWTILSFLADDGKKAQGRSKYLLVVTPDGGARNMHHDQLKLLQGFSSNFDLGSNPRIAVRAIGNACSPDHLQQTIELFCENIKN